MGWLTNGSKTLVVIAGVAAVAWLCVAGKITGDQALGMISLFITTYVGVNLYQNGKTNPPAPPETK